MRFGEEGKADALTTPQEVQEFYKDLPSNTVQRASPHVEAPRTHAQATKSVLKDTPARRTTEANRAAAYARDDAARAADGVLPSVDGLRNANGQPVCADDESSTSEESYLGDGWLADTSVESERQKQMAEVQNMPSHTVDGDRTSELAAFGKHLILHLDYQWTLAAAPV